MRKDVKKLQDAVGRVVSAVDVEVLFHGVGTKGEVGAILINFADCGQFAMTCAGDGGVFVSRSRTTTGSAPGFVNKRRTLAALCGELRAVSFPPRALRLQIDEHDLLLVNEYDELSVTVDRKPLPPEILSR